ncbi:4-aminobutyrate aminotransferase [Thermogladius calderae 1633]|uniref:4-aminobutyrate aminotransferase n=1 Tax=Thermogladius calderae (strain DSM 22663 / VKM B-2946 / 1633) TaxID=1184251 RepID=I3TG30_THEC1|nr:aspartate aminotransferase family protein [Thermogladius calderae]AFK51718.1 4-aminobutyrate aminotransferase [Thermogladius calderae 1633]
MDVEKLILEERKVVPRPFVLKYFPLVPLKGRGCKLYDETGREYIDLTSGAATYIVGFNHPDVVREVVEQVESLFNYTTLYFYNRPSIELAGKLVNLTPGGFPKKVVFGFSGADAMEIALTASLNYTRRGRLVSFTDSFHGTLVLPASVSGIIRDALEGLGGPWYKDVVFVEYPNPYRNKWGVDGYEKPGELTALALKELEEVLRGTGGVAAVVIEPVQGDAGVVVPPKDFVREVARLAGEHGSLLVVDEAQTGLGRTGAWWGVEHYGVAPDVLVSAKALGGGFPLSAVVARSDILEALPRVGLGFTNMGHAVSCRAALATIRVIEREGLIERARTLGAYLTRRLREIQENHPVIGDVRGLGLMVGVEVVEDHRSRRPSRVKALKVAWGAWRKGVITTTLGRHGNVLRLTPPLNIPLEDLEKAITVLEEAVKDVEEGRVPDEVVEGVEGWGSWS